MTRLPRRPHTAGGALSRNKQYYRKGLIELLPPRPKVNPCRGFARRTMLSAPEALFEAAVRELADLCLEYGKFRLTLLPGPCGAFAQLRRSIGSSDLRSPLATIRNNTTGS